MFQKMKDRIDQTINPVVKPPKLSPLFEEVI